MMNNWIELCQLKRLEEKTMKKAVFCLVVLMAIGVFGAWWFISQAQSPALMPAVPAKAQAVKPQEPTKAPEAKKQTAKEPDKGILVETNVNVRFADEEEKKAQ